jgi:hypothetical protein
MDNQIKYKGGDSIHKQVLFSYLNDMDDLHDNIEEVLKEACIRLLHQRI